MDKETRDGIRLGLRVFFAHHPLCSVFASDVVHRRFPVCSGCILTWPLFLVAFPVAWVGVLRHGVEPWALVASGVVLGLSQFTTYAVRWSRPVRAAVKALGGVGLGLAVAGGLLLPWPLGWKAVAAGLVLLAFTGMQALRVRSILRTCHACVWRRDWGRCPGFTPPHGWREPPGSWAPGAQGPAWEDLSPRDPRAR